MVNMALMTWQQGARLSNEQGLLLHHDSNESIIWFSHLTAIPLRKQESKGDISKKSRISEAFGEREDDYQQHLHTETGLCKELDEKIKNTIMFVHWNILNKDKWSKKIPTLFFTVQWFMCRTIFWQATVSFFGVGWWLLRAKKCCSI